MCSICDASLGRRVTQITATSSVALQGQPGQHATAHMHSAQHPEEQQPVTKDAAVAKHGNPAMQLAAHAEVDSLAQALREAEQRASAAELAVATVQRAHTEAVEQSARLQVAHAVKLVRLCSSLLSWVCARQGAQ